MLVCLWKFLGSFVSVSVFGRLCWLAAKTTSEKEIKKNEKKKKNIYKSFHSVVYSFCQLNTPKHTHTLHYTVHPLTMPFCTASSFHLTYNAAYSVQHTLQTSSELKYVGVDGRPKSLLSLNFGYSRAEVFSLKLQSSITSVRLCVCEFMDFGQAN